jgi:hypothetical protein
MVILLFTRLADLFDSKAAAKGLVIFSDREKKIYSEKIELWFRKLDDLDTEDFKRGMTNLEKKAEIDYREGNEMWPPSYAEFRALAFPKSGRDTQAHKVFDRPIGIEDQTAKAKRCEVGIKNTSSLLEMLDQPSPEKIKSEAVVSYGKQQLEKAREMLARKQ